jgi:hypothetical protein
VSGGRAEPPEPLQPTAEELDEREERHHACVTCGSCHRIARALTSHKLCCARAATFTLLLGCCTTSSAIERPPRASL